MKKNILLIGIILAITTMSCVQPSKHADIKSLYKLTEPEKDSSGKFAVLELFSSESCFDCPPAQNAMNKIIEKYAGKNIAIICEHVDYWNYLVWGEDECKGKWEDKYSDGYFASRQFAYANKNNVISGTPQVVVNGKSIVSDPKETDYEKLINEHYIFSAYEIALSLNQESDFDKQLSLNYTISIDTTKLDNSKKNQLQLLVFIVEKGLKTIPDKAENCNLMLNNENVVRAYKIITLKNNIKGNTILPLPADIELKNSQLIVFVQNMYNLDILGATSGYGFTIVK